MFASYTLIEVVTYSAVLLELNQEFSWHPSCND